MVRIFLIINGGIKMNYLKKTTILAVALLLISTSMFGCTSNEEPETNINEETNKLGAYPMEITDGAGNKVVIEKRPERIVSLAPSHTEIIYGLGLEDKLVGVTTYCDYPSEVKEKEKVGDSFTINIEKIIELQPDIIINYWPIEDGLRKQLQAADIIVLTYLPESIGQVIETIEAIGIVTDTKNVAEKIISDIENKKKEIIDIVKDAPRPKVFYEIEYSSALWTVGEGAFIDELIVLGGGENIAKDAEGAYAQYSVESLIEKDPEIYITNTFNMELQDAINIKDRPGFESIKAIKDENIKVLDGNILSRPSQRVMEALELMAEAIHPELFE